MATKNFPKFIKSLLYFTLLLLISTQTIQQYQYTQNKKDALHYLPYKNSGIYVGNAPMWVNTVKKTVQYLHSILKPSETFLALPYDPLYYFLTNKNSPTRDLIFFDHINIQPEQEKNIIQSLENKKVNYVLLSNRIFSTETGLGIFGQTYCPILGKYINEHFSTVAEFGDWKNEGGWAWNHGTKILKRIKPL